MAGQSRVVGTLGRAIGSMIDFVVLAEYFERQIGRAVVGAVKVCSILEVFKDHIFMVDFKVIAILAVVLSWSTASLAFLVTLVADARFLIGIVVIGTFIFTLLSSFVAGTFRANIFMEAKSSTFLASWVTFPADGFTDECF